MNYKKEDKQKIFKNICNRIAQGTILAKILEGKGMPVVQTFYNWLLSDTSLMEFYVQARDIQADVEFDETLTIADANDCTYIDHNKVKRIDGAAVQLKNVRISARQWRIARMNPKKYSSKLQVDVSEFKEQPLFNLDGKSGDSKDGE